MDTYYIDSNVVISIVETSQPLSDEQSRFLRLLDGGKVRALTSELTLAECLAKPFADRNAVAVAAFLEFLDGRPNFPVIPVSRDILLAAARLRGEKNVKLPDAIHLATARAFGCTVFLTNDRRLRSADDLKPQTWPQS